MTVAGSVVVEGNAPPLAVALGHDDALHLGPQRADGLDEARLVVRKMRLRHFVRRLARFGRGRPPIAGLGIPEEDEGAEPVLGRVRLPACHRELAPAAVAGAGGAHHHRIAAVGHHAGRAQRPQRIEDDARVRALDLRLVLRCPFLRFRPHRVGRNLARRLLLQQKLGRFDDRIAVEAVAQAALEDGVGNGGDRHAGVMREIVQHHGVIGALRHTLRREIDRVVVAVAAERADLAQALEVGDGLARHELRRQDRRVRRHHRVLAEAALQAEAGHAEIGVLIGQFPVAGVVGRFRDTPGNMLFAAILHLALDDEIARLVEDRSERLLHHQWRHQVLEHRARPRHQRALEADLDDRPAELEPVLGGEIALGDGEQTGQSRLRGQQVVTGLVELMFLDPVADREQLALLPHQEGEIHLEGEAACPLAQGEKLRADCFHGFLVGMGVLNVGFARRLDERRPVRHDLAFRGLDLRMDGGGELADLAGEDGQVDRSDRRHFRLCLDGADRAAHAVQPIQQTLPERAKLAPVVRQFAQALVENGDGVQNALEVALQVNGRRFRPLGAGTGDGHEMARQIAAVDRGNVERIKRLERFGVVPVEKMATAARHRLDRRKRGLYALERFGQADPAEIARRDDRKQVHADIGGRRALRHHRRRAFLEIVRRQVVVLVGDESLVIVPRPARGDAQRPRVLRRKVQPVFGFGRAADEPGKGRRADPEQREEEGDERARRIRQDRDRQADDADDDRAVHRRVVGAQRITVALLRLRGRPPLQQMLAGDEQAIEGPPDRIDHHPGQMRHEHDLQGHHRRTEGDIPRQGGKMPARGRVEVLRDDRVDHVEGRRHEQRQDQQSLPLRGLGEGQERPARDRGHHPEDRRDRAAQIVDHLPARQGRNLGARIEDEVEQLPVTPCPAMLAGGVDRVACGIILDQFDVGDERRARQRAFQQVVAENRVFLDTVLQRRFEGINVIEALAGEGAVLEDVLIEIRNREDIRVETPIGREDPLEERRLVACREGRRYARLKDGVAASHLSPGGIEMRLVERVHQLADEPDHRVARGAGIGVQRHDVDDVLRQRRVQRHEGRVAVAAQQEVELVQFAALALPAHPALLRGIVETMAVQKMETGRAFAWIARIEPGDLLAGEVEDLGVDRVDLGLAVRPIREQREVKLFGGVGEIMDLDIADVLLDIVARSDQRGHDDQRAGRGRNAVLVFVTDQPARFQEQQDDRVEEGERAFAGGNREQHQHDGNGRGRKAKRGQRIAGQPDQKHRQGEDGHDDAQPARAAEHPLYPLGQSGPEAQRLFQFATPRADEEEPDIDRLFRLRPLLALRGAGPQRIAGKLGGLLGDGVFRRVGTLRQFLYFGAILVARGEIQRGEIGALAQERVDTADFLEPDGPVHVVDEPEAADDVACGDVTAGQRLVLGEDDLLGIGAGTLQLALEPFERPAGVLRPVAQSVEKLRREGRILCMRRIGRQDHPVVVRAVGQHLVGDVVCDGAHVAGTRDPDGEPAQILDQHEAQQRRQRPDLADLHRLDRLETFDDGLEHACRHGAVGMRDIGPGDRQRARNGRAVRQLQGRKLAIEAARQIALDLIDRLLDHIVVVEHPLRGRRDGLALALRRVDGPIDLQDLPGVLPDARLEVERLQPMQVAHLALRETFAERSQSFLGQIGGANRFLGSRHGGSGFFNVAGTGLNVHWQSVRRKRSTARSPRSEPGIVVKTSPPVTAGGETAPAVFGCIAMTAAGVGIITSDRQ